MSDSLATLIVNAAVTIVSTVCAVIALWLKMRTAHQQTDKAIAANTDLTAKAAEVGVKAAEAAGVAGPAVCEAKDAIEQSRTVVPK